MHRDLQIIYKWNNKKRYIMDFLAKRLNYQNVNVEHQRPRGVTQKISIPT